MAVPRVAPSALLALLTFSLVSGSSSPASPCPTGKVPCPGTSSSSYKTCISPADLCDGIPDCPGDPGRTADETNCTACSSGAYLCKNDSRCIRKEWICDRTEDCGDGRDEQHCPASGTVWWIKNAPGTNLEIVMCDDHETRWNFVLCDGVKDCRDGNDEGQLFCDETPPSAFWLRFRFPVCHSGSVKCRRFGSPCVPAKKVCDGWVDCRGGEDERDCSGTSTTSTSTTTTSSAISRIPARTPSSTATSPSPCPTGKVPCPGTSSSSNNACISPADLCDGIPDCPGDPGRTADETNCTACSSGAYLCEKDSRCIRKEWICDRTEDCGDGQDEKCCANDHPRIWHGVQFGFGSDFSCDDRARYHRRRWDVVICDGVRDCPDGFDEWSNCTGMPPANFRVPVCHSGLKCRKAQSSEDFPCVPAKKVCDGWEDCLDGEDERNCSARSTSTETTAVTTTMTTISSSSSSIPATTPTSTATSTSPCPTGNVPCPGTSSSSNNTCILPGDLCDGIPDCPGVPGRTADETNCTACSSGAFLCEKDGRCIRREWVCDSTMDCSDGQDEKCCLSRRNVTWYGRRLAHARDLVRCDSVPLRYERTRWSVVLCDGVQDCEDGKDESNYYCGQARGPDKYHFPVCQFGSVRCRKPEGVADSPCVAVKKVCDGWVDCLFGEDESSCSATSTTSTTSMASSPSPARTPTSTATSPSVASAEPPEFHEGRGVAASVTSSSDAVRS